MVRSTSSLARARNPTDLIDRVHVGLGRQNPPTETLNWENIGWNHFQLAFHIPGVIDS